MTPKKEISEKKKQSKKDSHVPKSKDASETKKADNPSDKDDETTQLGLPDIDLKKFMGCGG